MKKRELVNLISSKRCNNRCRICARSREEIREMDMDEIRKNIDSLKEAGCRNMILTGGEPTLRDDIFEIIELCEKADLRRLHIQTNGRKFSDLEFTRKIASREIVDVFLSVHGHTPEIHESVTGVKGSFDESMKGIDNLISLDCSLRTNTVICGPNHRSLDEMAEMLIDKGVREIQFSFVHPRGEALRNPEMVPKIEESIPSLIKALKRNTDNVKILTEAVPFCLLGDRNVHAAERMLPESYRKEDFSKRKGSVCKGCSFFDICPGVWESYKEEVDFRPVSI